MKNNKLKTVKYNQVALIDHRFSTNNLWSMTDCNANKSSKNALRRYKWTGTAAKEKFHYYVVAEYEGQKLTVGDQDVLLSLLYLNRSYNKRVEISGEIYASSLDYKCGHIISETEKPMQAKAEFKKGMELQCSLHDIARVLGRSLNPNTYRAIRESLKRLSKVRTSSYLYNPECMHEPHVLLWESRLLAVTYKKGDKADAEGKVPYARVLLHPILGEGSQALENTIQSTICLKERAQLTSEIEKYLHTAICCRVWHGRKKNFKLSTLYHYVYGDNSILDKDKISRVKKAFLQLGELPGWETRWKYRDTLCFIRRREFRKQSPRIENPKSSHK